MRSLEKMQLNKTIEYSPVGETPLGCLFVRRFLPQIELTSPLKRDILNAGIIFANDVFVQNREMKNDFRKTH